MIPRKPSILLAFANTLHCTTCTPFSASQSSTSSARGTRSRQCRRNEYATIAGDARATNEHPERPQDPEHQWPDAPKGQSCPTPYQIFDMKHDGKYTKSLYYKMVKLYHPDLSSNGNGNSGPNAGLSHAAKVERYHLIVAAHTILSDPIKRSAYDRFGAGWNGKAEVGDKSTWSKPSPFHEAGPFSQSWMDPNDPVWQNATWEDWERWRQSKEGAKQKPAPVYMANSYFLACVVALAIIGSSLNVTRAQEAGTYIVESRDLVHDRAAKELRRVKQEVKGLSNRQDRIDFFVKQREATMGLGDNQALREERANRLLKDKEICSSEEVKERDT